VETISLALCAFGIVAHRRHTQKNRPFIACKQCLFNPLTDTKMADQVQPRCSEMAQKDSKRMNIGLRSLML
jgi:hypothetical protein